MRNTSALLAARSRRLGTFAVLALAACTLLSSCRSSRNNRSTASRNRTTPPPAAAPNEVVANTPSAKSVLSHADSALMRVSKLADDDRAAVPDNPPVTGYANNTPRTPWGAPYTPQPNLTDYGVYEAALGAYNAGRYDEAISMFSQVVTQGKPAELVPNAYYWMGEAFYGMNRYAESMPYFEYVTRVGPTYKREMSLYKLSRAALHLGNKQDGNLYYERLRNEYPHSSHIATLRKLGAR